MSDPAARRFTEEETTAIISRAARAQHAIAPVRETGLSLAELQELGEAAGLDRVHIGTAAATLQAEAVVAEQWLGLPTELRETRVIPVPVGDRAWERMVVVLREHFKSAGYAGQVGRVREWGPSPNPNQSSSQELRVSAAPHELGAVVTIHQRAAHHQGKMMLAAGGTLAFMGVVMAALAVATGAPAVLGLFGATNLLGGAAIGAWGLKWGHRLERARRAEFESLLDPLELIACSEEGRA